MSLSDIFKIVGAALFSVFSAGGIVWVLSSWLGKLWAKRIIQSEKAEFDRELEAFRQKSRAVLERDKYAFEKMTFVHRTQFEKEFEIYKDLWSRLVEVRAATRGGLTSDDKINEVLIQALEEKLSVLGDVVESNRPFFPQAIYDLVLALSRLAYLEMLGHTLGSEADRKRGAEELRIEKIASLSNQVCERIRERIESLEVQISSSSSPGE